MQLTADHKPSCPAEAARILSKGGRVERCGAGVYALRSMLILSADYAADMLD